MQVMHVSVCSGSMHSFSSFCECLYALFYMGFGAPYTSFCGTKRKRKDGVIFLIVAGCLWIH